MAEVLLHQVVDGERWDTLAFHYYGSATQYGRIVEANPHLDITPILPTGAIVLIPVVNQSTSADSLQSEELPPWKR
jgi:phage tail protein X